MGKKCTKKRDAHAKQSCCSSNLNLLLFCRSRCRRSGRCLSSLILRSAAGKRDEPGDEVVTIAVCSYKYIFYLCFQSLNYINKLFKAGLRPWLCK